MSNYKVTKETKGQKYQFEKIGTDVLNPCEVCDYRPKCSGIPVDNLCHSFPGYVWKEAGK